MRKITRQLVLLFVVFVIYFGYSAFVDGAALFHLTADIYSKNTEGTLTLVAAGGTQFGAAAWVNAAIDGGVNAWHSSISFYDASGNAIVLNDVISGYMAPNSLLYTILSPFKLVLVGGVFGLLVPLTQSIFFGTVIGIKNYMKTRRSNILFNYQAAIKFAVDLNATLSLGDNEQIKAQYAAFSGLAFKPTFMSNMMDEIGDGLIKELDLSVYIKPSETVIVALKEMYEKERRAAIAGRPDEMFFDLKRGYEYISIGSKYSINYYKALETGATSKSKLGWKLFSLEMFRLYVFMIFAIIPTIIFVAIALPLISKYAPSNVYSEISPHILIVSYFAITVILHASFTFSKSAYSNMRKSLVGPALSYYVLIMIMALTLSTGIQGIVKLGDLSAGGTAGTLMWPFFSALGYLVLSTCLVLYVIATLMDANRNPLGMHKKIMIDGVILPLLAWLLSTGVNYVGVGLDSNKGLFSGIAVAVTVGFWVYLSISSILLNNIVLPSRTRKLAIQAELAQQGKEAEEKKEQAKK